MFTLNVSSLYYNICDAQIVHANTPSALTSLAIKKTFFLHFIIDAEALRIIRYNRQVAYKSYMGQYAMSVACAMDNNSQG